MERILSNKTVLVTYPTTGRKGPPKFIHGIQKSGYKMGIGFAKCQEQRYYPKGLRGRHFPKLSAFINDPSYKDRAATYPEICKRDVISACNKQNSGPASESNQMKKLLTPVFKKVDAFCRFSRPHTVIGTIVGIISVSLLPLDSMRDLSPTFFIGLLKALLPAVFMNIYVVGLNQVFDVDIDKVNKPTLPLASGEISREVGTLIVICFFIMSFYMGFMFQSPPVIFFLLGFCFLGTAYSIDLPLLRWKQNAFLAASCIICVRGILIQLAFYVHMQSYVLGRQLVLKKSVVFATAFMWFFAAVIALFKDIPDVDGDRHFGIQSFTVRLGQERVFWLCIRLLLIAYGIAMLVGASSSNMCLSFVTVLGHAMLASLLWIRAQSVDTQNRALMSSFYMFIWKLFYAEYLLIPFVR